MAPNGATDTAKRLMDDDDDFLLDVDDGVELAPAGSANLLWDPTKPSPLHHRRATAWTARQALSFAAVFALVAAIVGLGVARPDLLGNFRPAPVLAPYSSHFFRDAIQEQRFFCDRMYPLLRDLVHLPQSKFPLRLESGISSFGQPHLNMYLHANPDAVSDAVRKFGFYNKPKSRAVLHELDLFLAKHPHLSEDNIALFDIGANIGWFTFLAASRGFRVVAFEPLPSNELAMRMSICLNNLTEQVVLFNKGLSSTHRECPLFSGARNVGTGFVVGCGEVSGNGTKYSTGYLQEVQEELAGWKHQPDRYWSDDEVENGPDKKKFVPPWGISPDDLDWLPPRLRRRTLHALRSLDKRFKFKHRGKVELVRLDDVMSEFTDGWGKDTQLAVIKMDVQGHEPAVLAGGTETLLKGLPGSNPKIVSAFNLNALGGPAIARSYAQLYFDAGYKLKVGPAGWRNQTTVKDADTLLKFVEKARNVTNIYLARADAEVLEVPEEEAEEDTEEQEAVEGVPAVPEDEKSQEKEEAEEDKEIAEEAKEEEFVEDGLEVAKPNKEGIEKEEKVDETTAETFESEENKEGELKNEAGKSLDEDGKPEKGAAKSSDGDKGGKPSDEGEKPAEEDDDEAEKASGDKDDEMRTFAKEELLEDVNSAESEIGTAEIKTGNGTGSWR